MAMTVLAGSGTWLAVLAAMAWNRSRGRKLLERIEPLMSENVAPSPRDGMSTIAVVNSYVFVPIIYRHCLPTRIVELMRHG